MQVPETDTLPDLLGMLTNLDRLPIPLSGLVRMCAPPDTRMPIASLPTTRRAWEGQSLYVTDTVRPANISTHAKRMVYTYPGCGLQTEH